MADQFSAINCQIVGCSTDSHFTHRMWTKTPLEEGGIGPLKFPLLSDLSHDIGKAYNCLIQSGDDAGVHLRATYIINPEGMLCCYQQNMLPIGRNVADIFRLVQACQFFEEHGEVCPSNWKPGKPTMDASHDSAKTQEYFAKTHAGEPEPVVEEQPVQEPVVEEQPV